MMRPVIATVSGLLLLSAAAPARASITFPGALENKLGLKQVAGPPPGCRLCHQTDAGGLKTATQPFGRTVLKAGAVGGSVPSLLAALDQIEAEGTDSDFDGVSDIDELKAGTDPNTPPVGSMTPQPPQVPLPETGCTLPRPTKSSSGAWLLALVVGVAAVARRRR
jgi:MYXO-CTERM domain-containing protein